MRDAGGPKGMRPRNRKQTCKESDARNNKTEGKHDNERRGQAKMGRLPQEQELGKQMKEIIRQTEREDKIAKTNKRLEWSGDGNGSWDVVV